MRTALGGSRLRVAGKLEAGDVDVCVVRGHSRMSSDRRNLTEPGDWWAAFERQAKADGQTLSEWAGDCMRANIPKDVAAGFSERPPANRPKKPKDEGR